MLRLLVLGLSTFTVAFAQVRAADDLRLDPQLPYQATRSNPVTYQVEFQVIVTAPYKTKLLKVWLPIPPSDVGQEFSQSQLSTFPQSVEPRIATEPKFGNRFAYFEFAAPQGAQIIRHQFTIKTYELRWQIEAARVATVNEWPASFEPYRQGESQAVVVDAKLQAALAEIVPRRGSPAENVASILQWTQRNLKYDHITASLTASSLHALEQRRGHCSDYHGFCASVGRALGYPTRVTYGINPFPKNSPSHCKLEVFMPPYGWVSFDVSETQRLIAAIQASSTLDNAHKTALSAAANQRLLDGYRDNTWYLQTRGTDYDLVPPAGRRVPVVRTIYAEADGEPLSDPDPANPEQNQFSWMTAHRYTPDRAVTYPFQDWKSLER